ncbi:MAG: universal stress protein [Actinomycetota bacterium]|nr:universal stress protein [Actinomycetota bacterium]
MILIAYDGSDDAKAAVERAGKLFPGAAATILTVWQRSIDAMTRAGGGITVALDFEVMDADAERAAANTAAAGAELAREASLDAQPQTAVVKSTVAGAVLATAMEAGAAAVVCGSRGHSGLLSLMLGSVSHHLIQHAEIPVVVVPSPVVAAARAAHREHLR